MATNYERGRAFEYRVRDHLLNTGAALVIRSAQSKGKVDLAAFWPLVADSQPWLVQCKRDGKLSHDEGNDLVAIADEVGALALLAYAGPKGRGVEFEILNTD